MLYDLDQQRELDRWQNLDWNVKHEDKSDFVSHKPLFIIGACARSGTTLLRVMLDTHPLLACGPESGLFLPTPADLQVLSNKFEIPLSTLQSLEAESASRSEFTVRFQEAYLSARERNIWGDKSSRNIHRLGEILVHFPNVKIIHMIRDVRDVVVSLKTHRKYRVVDGNIQPTGWKMPLENCIERWVRSINDALPYRGHPNYLEIKYEDLIAHRVPTLTKICEHIGVQFDPQMLDYAKVGGASRDPTYFPQNVSATQQVSTSSVGRWRKELPEDELTQVLKETHGLMQTLNYTL